MQFFIESLLQISYEVYLIDTKKKDIFSEYKDKIVFFFLL
jgi:hypothetical protein